MAAVASSLHTIASACTADGETVKGASFLASACPLDPARANEQAAAWIADVRREHAGAIHHGWAYRVGPVPADFRWSDDGEPVGSAGAAILRRIDALALLNVAVIVSRGSGSERLSVADLARGYGNAARAVLSVAQAIEFIPTTIVAVSFAYAHSGPVQGVLAAYRVQHEDATYGEDVRLVVRVASDRVAALQAAVRDATSGQGRVDPL